MKEIKGNVGNKGKGKKGVLYVGHRNRKFGWYDEEWEGVVSEYNFDMVKYEGEIKNGKSNGQGTFTYYEDYEDGKKYIGEFKDGKKNGQGTETYSDGSMYIGEFKNDKSHGQGTTISPDGDYYVGEHKDGKYHGQGTYTFHDDHYYVGKWKDGEPWNGKGYDKNGNILEYHVKGKWKEQ